ncbi:MAG: response regulator [Deltaproteobacteria bacterium]|nr:response regulator [Deltaproteobacteria bacterium]
MTRVLIVDDDPRMSSALAGELVRQGYDTQTADSVDAALELLLNAPVDVLVTDLRMSGRDGLDLIRMARATSPKTRAVLMSAYATAKDYKVAIELGAVDVLTKPFTPEDLEEAIRKALDSQSGVQGLVHGLSLVDVLQMFHFARRSLAIHVGGDGATIHLRDGEVVHAVSGAITGEAALRAILESQVSSVRTSPAVSVPITITRGFQALLLDLVRAIDEQGRSLPQPPGPASTGKTPTPDLVFDLGVGRQQRDHLRRDAPDPPDHLQPHGDRQPRIDQKRRWDAAEARNGRQPPQRDRGRLQRKLRQHRRPGHLADGVDQHRQPELERGPDHLPIDLQLRRSLQGLGVGALSGLELRHDPERGEPVGRSSADGAVFPDRT